MGLRPSSLSNILRPLISDGLLCVFDFLRDFETLGSGIPIFWGRFAFFARRMAASKPLESSLLASIDNFRLFCFRVNPESLSLFGWKEIFVWLEQEKKHVVPWRHLSFCLTN